MWNRNQDTICAISTPHGMGGLAVIRISGSEALASCRRLSKTLNKKKIESHKAYFSQIFSLAHEKIDDVVFTYFAQGKSFTGEEVVEISCHGSSYIAQQILDALTGYGCRLADKGEFTFRAFMNGKLDLVQAESILCLIESKNQDAAKVALRQLDGHVSKQIGVLASDLTWCLAHIEASIDFVEQGVETADNEVLIKKLVLVAESIRKLTTSYQAGKLIKDGIRVVLVGESNVGKSSLLNLLLLEDKAIVTPIAGTTRDVIDGETIYDGRKYCIVDTAGLRETQDQVEIIGIDKSKKEAEKADILCVVFDCAEKEWGRSLQLVQQLKNQKKVFLLNKAELMQESEKTLRTEKIKSALGLPDAKNILFTSSMRTESRDSIFAMIKMTIGSFEYLDEAVISSARQYEQLRYAENLIYQSIEELKNNIGSEFVAMNLKEALVSLQKVLGQVYDDQILDQVFKEFCLGK